MIENRGPRAMHRTQQDAKRIILGVFKAVHVLRHFKKVYTDVSSCRARRTRWVGALAGPCTRSGSDLSSWRARRARCFQALSGPCSAAGPDIATCRAPRLTHRATAVTSNSFLLNDRNVTPNSLEISLCALGSPHEGPVVAMAPLRLRCGDQEDS